MPPQSGSLIRNASDARKTILVADLIILSAMLTEATEVILLCMFALECLKLFVIMIL